MGPIKGSLNYLHVSSNPCRKCQLSFQPVGPHLPGPLMPLWRHASLLFSLLTQSSHKVSLQFLENTARLLSQTLYWLFPLPRYAFSLGILMVPIFILLISSQISFYWDLPDYPSTFSSPSLEFSVAFSLFFFIHYHLTFYMFYLFTYLSLLEYIFQ